MTPKLDKKTIQNAKWLLDALPKVWEQDLPDAEIREVVFLQTPDPKQYFEKTPGYRYLSPIVNELQQIDVARLDTLHKHPKQAERVRQLVRSIYLPDADLEARSTLDRLRDICANWYDKPYAFKALYVVAGGNPKEFDRKTFRDTKPESDFTTVYRRFLEEVQTQFPPIEKPDGALYTDAGIQYLNRIAEQLTSAVESGMNTPQEKREVRAALATLFGDHAKSRFDDKRSQEVFGIGLNRKLTLFLDENVGAKDLAARLYEEAGGDPREFTARSFRDCIRGTQKAAMAASR